MERSALDKLADGFDEFKERLIRIEESVKPIASIKSDVDGLKIESSETSSSTRSAHKRLDTAENSIEKLPTRSEYNGHDVRIGKLEKLVHWIATLIISTVIIAILGVVLVTQ